MSPAKTYYAVIFTSKRTSQDEEGYSMMSDTMMELAKDQPGFLGVEHARDAMGITVSYWESLESIAKWKSHTEHRLAQHKGQLTWYEEYKIRICRVEREYSFFRKED